MTDAKHIDVAGESVFVRDAGRGPAAVFLHGNPDSSDMWRAVMAQLRDQFRCVAPDLPGFGRSPRARRHGWRCEASAHFVDGLVTSLELQRPLNLVVHDVGAFYGLPWAMDRPGDVASITVINAPFSSSYRWHAWARVWRTPVLGEMCMRAMNRRLFCWVINRASPRLPPEHAQAAYTLYKPRVRTSVLELYRSIDKGTLDAWETRMAPLARMVPTTVLWGDCDPYVAPEFASRFGTRRVRHFPEYGHWLPVEAPRAVAACLRECFLEAESAPLDPLAGAGRQP